MRAQLGWGALAAVAAFVLGGLTSVGQTVLPDALQPLANSASGWTLLTVLVLWWLPVPTWLRMVLGALGFVLLNVGYAVVADLRGFFYNPLLWSVVGVLVGPFVGLAISWARRRTSRPERFGQLRRAPGEGPRRAAVGFGFLAGLLLGDAASGFVRVRDTTGWFYWTAVGLGAVVWVVVVLLRRFPARRDRLTLVGMTVATAAALVVGLEVLQVLLS